jgi:hypothetical protein
VVEVGVEVAVVSAELIRKVKGLGSIVVSSGSCAELVASDCGE